MLISRLAVWGLLAASPFAAFADASRFDRGGRWLEVALPSPAATSLRPMFGKINADAMMDLVLYNYLTGEAFVAFSDGARFAPPVRYSFGLPQFTQMPPDLFEQALVDLDGNGLDDLVIMNHGADDIPGAATAVVALNVSGGFNYPPEKTWNPSWCAGYQRCLSGDINGDGLGDLTAFTPEFGVLWGTTSTGSLFGANAIWNNFFCILGEVCAMGDVNGDGRDDAIAFKPRAPDVQHGNVLWSPSTGSSFGDVQLGHGFFCIDNETCLVGDVNGDGRDDIVLAKGWGTGSPTLEVLVSLSNGSQFINADPFAWAQVPFFDSANETFGIFDVADITGDGREDLIQWGLTATPDTGGGSRTTGWGIDVFPVTDRPVTPAPTPPTQPTPQPGGFGSVAMYNCQTEQNRLHYWTFDTTTGAVSQTGPIDAMYDEFGTCPDFDDPPETIALEPGHVHVVVAVDPLAIGCDGQNDPGIVACAYSTIAVQGLAGGGTCHVIVGAQVAACSF